MTFRATCTNMGDALDALARTSSSNTLQLELDSFLKQQQNRKGEQSPEQEVTIEYLLLGQ